MKRSLLIGGILRRLSLSHTKGRGLTGIFLVVGTIFALFSIFAFFTVRIFSTELSSSSEGGVSEIAVVEIEGVIMQSREIVERLEQAASDDSIKGIILRINSPGGAVGPTQEIYHEVRRIDKNIKPIISSFGSVAASGGYYLGAATRKIYSNPGTITGSIGVIMQFLDMSKLYELAKVVQHNVKAGRYKDAGSPSRAMTKEERGMMDEMLKGVHQQFIHDILSTRKKKIKGEIRDLAQGQIFSGEQAYQHGLVDELGSLWKAGRDFHRELKLKGKFSFRFIKKKKKVRFLELIQSLDGLLSKIENRLNISSSPTLLFKW